MDYEHFGLYEKSYQEMVEYFKYRPKIKMVKIYGSRAKGNWENGSDVDFAIFGDLTYDEINRIYNDLYNLPTPYKFDVTHYDTLKHQGLKDHIDRVGVVFYQKED